MFFVIDKPKLQRIIAIVRDDRTRKTQKLSGPILRMEARDGKLTLAGQEVKATFPSTVYEPGVLFLHITAFRRLLRSITNEKTIAIQVTADGLIMDNITMPLEPNEMLLYVDPEKAPDQCPLELDLESQYSEKWDLEKPEPELPLFDGLKKDKNHKK